MGIFSKLFGGSSDDKEAATTTSTEQVQAQCPHSTLTGRWDSVADMGHLDRATRFVCESCHTEFSPEDAKRIQEESRLPITDTVHSARP